MCDSLPAKLFVLGHPVAHSKSPAMHNAAYRALGLAWEYGLADCATERQAREVLEARDWLACNITMPYKPLAFAFADSHSSAATMAQGANVLVRGNGHVHADNTDGKGCVAFLQRCGAQVAGANVVVCGTGPTSLSILHACVQAGAAQVLLFGRDPVRTQQATARYTERWRALRAGEAPGNLSGASGLDGADSSNGPQRLGSRTSSGFQGIQRDLRGCHGPDVHDGSVDQENGNNRVERTEADGDSPPVLARVYDPDGVDDIASADIVVDATPLGMNPGDPAPFNTSALSARQTVLDVVYAHGETALLAAARAAGCNAHDGVGMLVGQAVETVRDIADITGAFVIPDDLDLFDVMQKAIS